MRISAHAGLALALVVVGLVTGSAPARADVIVVDPGILAELADNGTDATDDQTLDITSGTGTLTASVNNGDISSTGTYSITGTQLRFDVDQKLKLEVGPDDAGGTAQSSTLALFFTVNRDAWVELSGAYGLLDADGAAPAQLGLTVTLFDESSGTALFELNTVQGGGSPLVEFGNPEIDGVIRRQLLAGVQYRLDYAYTLSTDLGQFPDDGGPLFNDATASGFVQLTVVPVPAAVWGGMALMGAVGSVGAVRRRLNR